MSYLGFLVSGNNNNRKFTRCITEGLHANFQKYLNFDHWLWNWVYKGFCTENRLVDPDLYIIWIFDYIIRVYDIEKPLFTQFQGPWSKFEYFRKLACRPSVIYRVNWDPQFYMVGFFSLPNSCSAGFKTPKNQFWAISIFFGKFVGFVFKQTPTPLMIFFLKKILSYWKTYFAQVSAVQGLYKPNRTKTKKEKIETNLVTIYHILKLWWINIGISNDLLI